MDLDTPPSTCELFNIEQLKGKDVVILSGKTRAGESTFINDAYGSNIVKSTGSMTSDTDMISYVTTPLSGPHPRYSDIRDIYLVDTIGLSGSGKDHHRTVLAAKWIDIFRLLPETESVGRPSIQIGPLHPTVKGFLYFIDINDDAGPNQENKMNLEFFERLIGSDPDVLRGQERRFKEWEKELQRQFPGSSIIRLDGQTSRIDIEDLDESLEENQNTNARARIAQEKENYADNTFAVLRRVIATLATVATKLEHEVRTGDGNEANLKKISIGQTAVTEAADMECAFRQSGHSDLADIVLNSMHEFGDTKVKDVGNYVKSRKKFWAGLIRQATEVFSGRNASAGLRQSGERQDEMVRRTTSGGIEIAAKANRGVQQFVAAAGMMAGVATAYILKLSGYLPF